MRIHRFHSLDALRGLAALSVVLWHWQSFFFLQYELPSTFDRTSQPLFAVLKIFYLYGWLAVDLFFLLSGFVFFSLYAQRIATHAVSARDFFVMRFSRLYPLHAVTLIAVAVGQVMFLTLGDGSSFFVYKYNDAFHFLLNVLMASSVGLEKGYSFNGPFWSVSVEVFLYLFFFVFCFCVLPHLRHAASKALVTALPIAAGIYLISIYQPIGRGLISFFLGGLIGQTFEWLSAKRRILKFTTAVLLAMASAVWMVSIAFVYENFQYQRLPLLWRLSAETADLIPHFVLFPLTVLGLALLDSQIQRYPKFLSALGSISYSTYLWHFPLQLALISLATACGFAGAAFNNLTAQMLFFALLVAVSLLSYHKLEVPAQQFLRRRWLIRGSFESGR